ncbi:MAG TPA: argininosuccinate lyase [Leptospiraceae bacterium]|nr:argininosuccinate lyase [Leptospiraceae bacterium]HMY68747.1 argininosuccinate lyase [Leptospiraceae bacterium]HNF16087.1 argininosuccinate lyase [Leptospiraceae bacterium]HNM03160.1 argininosuccinate lyase [Leptospiraceae bacterium]HNN04390.1 argininosuccinate lyase [Leptospiraceae bacterium]
MDKKETKLWGGRFSSPTSPIMERIGESISFDYKLYHHDILGSRAHSKNLKQMGILTEREFDDIQRGLTQIEKEIEEGKLKFRPELEDIHMHIESRLTELIGSAGKKLHTARSRNDQVAQDVRLYLKDSIVKIQNSLKNLLEAVLKKAEASTDIIMPGYTHLQVAQPIRASHYLLAHFWALYRDFRQFLFAKEINDVLVLGSGALAGVNYPTDRDLIAEELGLSKLSQNSIDAVSQRDHLLNYLFASSQLMIHLSRMSEEIIIFNTVEFSYIQLPDALTTGSSIMPQKKNPDIAELIRGKSARVIGHLNQMMFLLKGLPLAYNRDLQEDKIPVFETEETVLVSLEGMTEMIKSLKFQEKNMKHSLEKGFAAATDLADFLVNRKGVPFRDAHEYVGRLVGECAEQGYVLSDAPESLRTKISHFFTGKEYEEAVSLSASADKKNVFGGTAKERQTEQIELARKRLNELG